jgi:hypothetical protein
MDKIAAYRVLLEDHPLWDGEGDLDKIGSLRLPALSGSRRKIRRFGGWPPAGSAGGSTMPGLPGKSTGK